MKNQLILPKLKNALARINDSAIGDYDVSQRTRMISSLVMALSGLLLYIDKAVIYFGINIPMPEKFIESNYSLDIFIWITALSICPMILMICSFFKPYLYAALIPMFCYTIQIYFVLIDTKMVDDGYSVVYSVGITILLFTIMLISKDISVKHTKRRLQVAREKIKSKLRNAKEA